MGKKKHTSVQVIEANDQTMRDMEVHLNSPEKLNDFLKRLFGVEEDVFVSEITYEILNKLLFSWDGRIFFKEDLERFAETNEDAQTRVNDLEAQSSISLRVTDKQRALKLFLDSINPLFYREHPELSDVNTSASFLSPILSMEWDLKNGSFSIPYIEAVLLDIQQKKQYLNLNSSNLSKNDLALLLASINREKKFIMVLAKSIPNLLEENKKIGIVQSELQASLKGLNKAIKDVKTGKFWASALAFVCGFLIAISCAGIVLCLTLLFNVALPFVICAVMGAAGVVFFGQSLMGMYKINTFIWESLFVDDARKVLREQRTNVYNVFDEFIYLTFLISMQDFLNTNEDIAALLREDKVEEEEVEVTLEPFKNEAKLSRSLSAPSTFFKPVSLPPSESESVSITDSLNLMKLPL